MHEAVPHEGLKMAIDRRLRRGEFARELGNADGLSRSCESFQQAQCQIDGLGCRTLVRESPLSRRLSKSYDFGHGVSHNETVFHYSTKPCCGCQRLGTMLRKALTVVLGCACKRVRFWHKADLSETVFVCRLSGRSGYRPLRCPDHLSRF